VSGLFIGIAESRKLKPKAKLSLALPKPNNNKLSTIIKDYIKIDID